MTMDERIESAAQFTSGERNIAGRAIRAAFPELFADPPTHMLVEIIKARPGTRVAEMPDGTIVVAHPSFPPHVWDGKEMRKIELAP